MGISIVLKRFTVVAALTIAANFGIAAEVGDTAQCVVLDQVKNGQTTEHCIRDPDVAGQAIVIEFFSITCSACIANIPNIKTLAAELGNSATVRYVSIDRNESAVRDFIQRHDIKLEVAFDTERTARRAYDIVATPTLFVLNPNNEIIYKHIGTIDSNDINEIKSVVSEIQNR